MDLLLKKHFERLYQICSRLWSMSKAWTRPIPKILVLELSFIIKPWPFSDWCIDLMIWKVTPTSKKYMFDVLTFVCVMCNFEFAVANGCSVTVCWVFNLVREPAFYFLSILLFKKNT